MAFNCVIVTPEQQILDERCSQVILPAHDGEMGILTGRAPILVRLGVGRLRVDLAGGRSASFYVDGGVAQMRDDRLTVLTDNAMPVEQLDAAAAQAELDAAVARTGAAAERQHAIDRARAKQRLATR
jgi:F-type H+-transporting ATPase subunit epsilon